MADDRQVTLAGAMPDPSCGIQVEWMWGAGVTVDVIDAGLREFAAAGITEVVIEPWDGIVGGTEPGISTTAPYLSDAFWNLVGHALHVARELGLHIWLYDGNAAGDDTGAVHKAMEGRPDLVGYSLLESGEVIRGGADKLNPAFAQALLDVQHRELAARFPDFVATTFVGTWKDEPRLTQGAGIPWCPDFDRRFDKQAVFTDRATRIAYWGAVAQTFSESYFAPIERWHASLGLTFLIQPMNDAGQFASEMRDAGTKWVYQRHAHVPGCDMWPGRTNDEAFRGETGGGIIHAQCASIAHMYSRERAQGEPYGWQGWGLELARQKVLADRMYVRGINMVSPAVTHATLDNAQSVFIGDFGPMNTFWDHYDLLQAYLARVGTALKGARHMARMAMVYPMTSVWSDASRAGDLLNVYSNCAGAMQVSWRNFDVVTEQMLAEPETVVRSGALCRHDHAFTCVLLPGLHTILASTVALLERFVAEGGALIAVGRLPDESDADDVSDRVAALMESPRAEMVDIDLSQSSRIDDPALLQPLFDAMDRLAAPNAVITNPAPLRWMPANEVYHCRRGDTDLFFVNNYPDGAHDAASPAAVATDGEIWLPVIGTPECWDPDRDVSWQPLRWRAERGGTVVPLHIPPYGSIIIGVRPGAQQQPEPVSSPAQAQSMSGPFDVTYEACKRLPISQQAPGAEARGLGDIASDHPGFSGTATYAFDADLEGVVSLDLGDVAECADVYVDGDLVGRRAWPPYVFGPLPDGRHRIEIRVTSTASNAMPSVDYEPAKPWGLFGPVTLTTGR